jgi:outer membrane protein assembly factor BamB
MLKLTHYFLLIAFTTMLSSCALFDKDNTPPPKALTEFHQEVNPQLVWTTKAGDGVNDEYLKMGPTLGDGAIYTSSLKGTVTAVSKDNGARLWQTETKLPVTTSPGAGDGIVVVGSRQGDVIALRENDGRLLWKNKIKGEILAKPAVANGNVVIKAVDGYTRAFSVTDGHELWAFQQVEPNLILRGSSAPLISNHNVIVGFANGNLAELNLRNGQLNWMQTVAIPEGLFAIQRMIDIDADPLVYDHRIYAATYQGKIASLGWDSGRILWSHDLSSYTGMTADHDAIYVSDAKSYVWGFNADSGLVNWRQTQLEHRTVSGPATMGSYVVVGDGQGFLHWLSKHDGHFAARRFAGAAIYAAPIVENGVLYAITNKGYLVAYRL